LIKGGGMKGKIVINQDICKGCELCISFCPRNLITLADKLNIIGYTPASFKDSGECTACTSCALVCPEVAIEVYRD
jgi:2-oxoglutarate ferredoxin oxidoreductase subunit delta